MHCISASSDYLSIVSTLSFTPGGPTRMCASIPLLDNHHPEGTEEFTVTALSDIDAILLDPIEVTVTILDNDGKQNFCAILVTCGSSPVDGIVEPSVLTNAFSWPCILQLCTQHPYNALCALSPQSSCSPMIHA